MENARRIGGKAHLRQSTPHGRFFFSKILYSQILLQ